MHYVNNNIFSRSFLQCFLNRKNVWYWTNSLVFSELTPITSLIITNGTLELNCTLTTSIKDVTSHDLFFKFKERLDQRYVTTPDLMTATLRLTDMQRHMSHSHVDCYYTKQLLDGQDEVLLGSVLIRVAGLFGVNCHLNIRFSSIINKLVSSNVLIWLILWYFSN